MQNALHQCFQAAGVKVIKLLLAAETQFYKEFVKMELNHLSLYLYATARHISASYAKKTK